jgi:hypothetical protein
VVRELLLADGPVRQCYHLHIGLCNTQVTGTWMEAHPAFPGLSAGDTALIGVCGPLYKVKDDAKVLMFRDPLFQPVKAAGSDSVPPEVDAPWMRAPAVVAGTLGRGRVVRINSQHPLLLPNSLGRHPHLQGDFLGNIFRWVAQGKE